MQIEFFFSPDGNNIIINENDNIRIFKENDNIIDKLYNDLSKKFIGAFNSLNKLYDNKYDSLFRFISCNFSNTDNILDINNEQINIEYITCPIRKECKYAGIICNPKFTSGLSKREEEIAINISKGYTSKEIALLLNISKTTVDTHTRNIMCKTLCRNKADITKLAINSIL